MSTSKQKKGNEDDEENVEENATEQLKPAKINFTCASLENMVDTDVNRMLIMGTQDGSVMVYNPVQ